MHGAAARMKFRVGLGTQVEAHRLVPSRLW